MKSTDIGLADLARALRSLNPATQDCPSIAELLGLRGNFVFQRTVEVEPAPRSEFQPVASTETGDEDPEGPGPAVEAGGFDDPGSGLPDSRAGHGRPARRQRAHRHRVEPQVARPSENEAVRPTTLTLLQSPASAEMPSYIAEAEEIYFPDAARQLPVPQPIVSDAQLRALVTTLVSVSRPGEPDVERIVAVLASGKPLRRIPRKTRAGIVQHVRVWIDTAHSMRLFQADAARALRAIRRVAGDALRSEVFIDGPPHEEDLPRGADGVLLILSTLGIGVGELDESQAMSGWRRVAAACASRGLRPVAMVPFQPARWPRDLQRGFRLVPWHPPGARARSATPGELRRLARVLSLAAVIDPALLRAARRRMLPEADASAEIDFANSPWVAVWNPRVISLYPKALERLRSELAVDSELLETARFLVNQRPLSDDWARVVFEENLVFLALQGTPDGHAALEADLFRVIKSLLGRMNNSATARWALSFLDELPDAARQTRAALLLRAVASMLLSTAPGLVADIVASQDAGWIFQHRTTLGVAWTGQHILVREPPYSGDTFLEVPSTRPMIVMVADVDSPRKKVLRLARYRSGWTPAAHLPQLLKTVDGAVYRLDDAAQVWEKLQHSLVTQETIPGTVRGEDNGLFLVDVGLRATMSEASVFFGGGNRDQLEGREVRVRVLRIHEGTNAIQLGFGPAIVPPAQAWDQLESACSSFQRVRGRVVAVGYTGCRVVVSGVNAFLALERLAKDDGPMGGLLGRELEFQVMTIRADRHSAYLTRRMIAARDWQKVREAFQSAAPISGRIVAVREGGFDVELPGQVLAFLPSSQFDFVFPEEPERLVGELYDFQIVKIEDDRKNVVISRLSLLEVERHAKRQALLDGFKIGDVVNGTVKNLTDFGAFIDLTGIDGLLHITDMTWGRLNHPSEMLKVGQEVTVKVLDINREKERVSLGLKQLQSNPWDKMEERFPIGKRVKGKVTGLEPYGALVELEGGVEGLIHAKEIRWTRRTVRPADVLSVGQEVEAAVLEINKSNQRISLSLRQLKTNPWDEIEKKYPPGTVVKRQVRNMTAYGAFVEIEEGIDGMIHVSDLSWTRKINQPSEMLKKGDVVEAVVSNVDKQNQHIGLSVKLLNPDPWKDIEAKYKIGDVVTGRVTKVVAFGVFVRLKDDIAGLVHISQLSEDHVSNARDAFEVGQDVEARVIKIDKTERRIGLSIKAASYSEEDLKRESKAFDSLPPDAEAAGPD